MGGALFPVVVNVSLQTLDNNNYVKTSVAVLYHGPLPKIVNVQCVCVCVLE